MIDGQVMEVKVYLNKKSQMLKIEKLIKYTAWLISIWMEEDKSKEKSKLKKKSKSFKKEKLL